MNVLPAIGIAFVLLGAVHLLGGWRIAPVGLVWAGIVLIVVGVVWELVEL